MAKYQITEDTVDEGYYAMSFMDLLVQYCEQNHE